MFERNLKKDIYRLYNKTIKNVRKRQYSNNQESRIRNDTSQNDNEKEKCQESLTGLLRNSLKTLRNLEKTTNRSRNDIHK